jgi:hypothetical protein
MPPCARSASDIREVALVQCLCAPHSKSVTWMSSKIHELSSVPLCAQSPNFVIYEELLYRR